MVGSNIDYSKNEAIIDTEDVSFITTVEDAEEVSDNSAYKLRDIYLTGIDGFVKWTMAITNLRPGRQTRGHNHPDKDELCEIKSGDALITIDDNQYRVNTGKFILIERGKHHKVFNVSNTNECVFISSFPGHLLRSGFVRKRG